MKRSDFIFNSDKEAKKYYEFNFEMLKPLLIVTYLDAVIGEIAVLSNYDSPQPARIITFINLGMLVLGFFVYLKFKKYTEPFIIVNMGMSYFFSLYFRVYHVGTTTAITAYARGINQGIFQTFFVQASARIYHFVIFEGLAIISKSILLKDADKGAIGILVASEVGSIFFKLVMELWKRKMYIKNIEQRNSMEKFKDLIDQHLQTSFLVVERVDTKVLFSNQSFKKEFAPKGVGNIHFHNVLNSIHLEEESKNIDSTKCDPDTVLGYLKLKNDFSSPGHTLHCFTLDGENKKKQYELQIFSHTWDNRNAIGLVFTNITQQYEIIKLKNDEAAKEMAISTVAHELRNPLSGLFGTVEAMEKITRDPALKTTVNMMKTNIQYLMCLLNSILDMQMIKSQKLKIHKSKFDIRELFHSIMLLFEHQCSIKNIGFKLDIQKEINYFIETDRNRLMQILINLCANAIKFTFQGSITMAFRANDHGRLIFSVSDTGVGMTEEEVKNLFQVFGKLESTSSFNRSGVGLGLFISNSLVKLLNDDPTSQITVKSQFHVGTTFTFEIDSSEVSTFLDGNMDLSLLIDNEPEVNEKILKDLKTLKLADVSKSFLNNTGKIASDDLGLNTPPKNFDSNVMVVDDNPFNLYAARNILEEYKIGVKFSFNGSDAIDKLIRSSKSDNVKLILMDIEMPVVDGIEATKILVETMKEKTIDKIPIIGCSGHEEQNKIKECIDAGMENVFKKPLQKEDLEILLKKYNLV